VTRVVEVRPLRGPRRGLVRPSVAQRHMPVGSSSRSRPSASASPSCQPKLPERVKSSPSSSGFAPSRWRASKTARTTRAFRSGYE
jgi:hypothetical protein